MKIVSGLLLAGAFLYAAWLVLLRRRAPDPDTRTGWRRGFLAAVALFAAYLAGCSGITMPAPDGAAAFPPQHDDPAAHTQPVPSTLWTATAEAWRALNRLGDEPNPGGITEWKTKWDALEAEAITACQREIAQGRMSEKDAQLLLVVLQTTSYHYRMTRTKAGHMHTCYLPTPAGSLLTGTADQIWERLGQVRAAHETGRVDDATARKALLDLCTSVEVFRLLGSKPAGLGATVTFRTPEEERCAQALMKDAWKRMGQKDGTAALAEELTQGTFDEASERVTKWLLLLEGIPLSVALPTASRPAPLCYDEAMPPPAKFRPTPAPPRPPEPRP